MGDASRTDVDTARKEDDALRTQPDATDLLVAKAHLEIVRVHMRMWRALQRRLERRARMLRRILNVRPGRSVRAGTDGSARVPPPPSQAKGVDHVLDCVRTQHTAAAGERAFPILSAPAPGTIGAATATCRRE